jgi:hypothetical protein
VECSSAGSDLIWKEDQFSPVRKESRIIPVEVTPENIDLKVTDLRHLAEIPFRCFESGVTSGSQTVALYVLAMFERIYPDLTDETRPYAACACILLFSLFLP